MQSIFKTKEAYYKAIGFKEENGKLENRDTYVERVRSCMKLYGALVQVHLFPSSSIYICNIFKLLCLLIPVSSIKTTRNNCVVL